MARQHRIEILEGRRLLAAASLFPHYSLGSATDSAVADLNRDSKADIVTVTGTGITVAYGDGAGEFPTRFKPTLPSGFYSNVVVADFNADGRLDIASFSISPNVEVAVLLQLPTGFFGTAQRLAASGTPGWTGTFGLVAPDLNADGRADIVVGTYDTRGAVPAGFSTFTSNASGGFSTPVQTTVPDYPIRLVAGDFDGDGKQDVAVASQSQLGHGTDALTVHLGSGTGAFAAAQSLDLVSVLGDVASGDINGDGIADLVTAHGSVVSVFSKSGNSFARSDIDAGVGGYKLAVADLDLNGKKDIFIVRNARAYETAKITSLYQFAGGFTASTVSTTISTFLEKSLFADFDRDGRLDVSLISNGSLEIWFGAPGGGFRFRSDVLPFSGSGDNAIRLVDINGDGALDMVGRYPFSSTPAQRFAPSILVALANGTGGFLPPVHYEMPVATHNLNELGVGFVAADLNGDGFVDLAMCRSLSNSADYQPSKLCILYGLSGGGFGNYAEYTTDSGVLDLVAADFDNDGRTDVVTSGYFGARLFYGQVDGTLGGSIALSFSGKKVIVCDLNNDGRKDLLSNAGGAILINRPTGFQQILGVSKFFKDFELADMNGDGLLDLIVVDDNSGAPSNPVMVRIYQGLATGPTSTAYFATNPTSFAASMTPGTLQVGDVSGDGVPDVVLGSLGVMLGTSGGGLSGTTPFNSVSGPSTALGDVTGDGRLDIVNGGTVYPNLGTFSPMLAVTSSTLDLDQTRTIKFDLSRALRASTLAASDLQIENLSTGGTYVATGVTLSTDRKSITFTLPANMADGNYRFTLAATSIGDFSGNGMSADFVEAGRNAYILTGDVNHDRTVNFDDLLVVARNYGKVGQTFAQGNVTRDTEGRVDFDDLLRLAQHFGTTLFSATRIATRRSLADELLN